MLTSQKVIDAINEQIGYEFSAELQYYAIGAHFAAEALPQLSQHFFRQAEEEKGHALRFIKYIVDAGGCVVIPAIDALEVHAHELDRRDLPFADELGQLGDRREGQIRLDHQASSG